ncbi:hypothetical protein EAH81_16065 [Flavobacterium pectinovorum]|uniref:Uncharacterized protein n=1 Tax=Flavobacterium pectinovorum TaxID=29533 RepID=A0A502EL23_9FLAO|nr:hypothetical protein EAH81_16065 [Flavobacterium pectinovorum]
MEKLFVSKYFFRFRGTKVQRNKGFLPRRIVYLKDCPPDRGRISVRNSTIKIVNPCRATRGDPNVIKLRKIYNATVKLSLTEEAKKKFFHADLADLADFF